MELESLEFQLLYNRLLFVGRLLPMKKILLQIFVLLSALMLYAGEVTGTWKGKLETAMGPMASTVTFHLEEGKLTGLVKTDLYEAKIEKAAWDGNTLSFITNTDFGILTYEGTVTGDDMKLHVTGQDGHPLPMNLKKEK